MYRFGLMPGILICNLIENVWFIGGDIVYKDSKHLSIKKKAQISGYFAPC